MVAEERLVSEPLSVLVPDSEGEGTIEYPGKVVEPKPLIKDGWLEKFPEASLGERPVPVEDSLPFDDERELDGFSGFRVTVYMIMGGVKRAEERPVFVELGNVVAGEMKDNVKLARLVIVRLSILLLISLEGFIDDVLSFNGVVDEPLSLSLSDVGAVVKDGRSLDGSTIGADDDVEAAVDVLSSLPLSLSEPMVVEDVRSLEGGPIGVNDEVEAAVVVLSSFPLSLSESMVVEDGRSLEGNPNGVERVMYVLSSLVLSLSEPIVVDDGRSFDGTTTVADDGVEEAWYVLSSLVLSLSDSMVVEDSKPMVGEDGRSFEGVMLGANDDVEAAVDVLSSLLLSLSEPVIVEDGRSLEGITIGANDGVTEVMRLDGLSLSLSESFEGTGSLRSFPSAREVNVSSL